MRTVHQKSFSDCRTAFDSEHSPALRGIVGIVLLAGGVAVAAPVKGRVVDGAGRPIADAKVSVEGSPESVRTGVDGVFVLEAEPGANLLVQRTGFGLGLGTAGGADVVLLPEETIELRERAPVEAPGAVRLDRDSIKRIAGGGNDVVRSMSTRPHLRSIAKARKRERAMLRPGRGKKLRPPVATPEDLLDAWQSPRGGLDRCSVVV